MSDISKTERRLKSNAGDTPDLQGVIGDRDPGEVDIFGYQVIYTTGEFTVPRDDLLTKMDDVGLPEWMAPGRVAPHRAFGRMIDDLDEDEELEFQGHRLRLDFATGDSHYTQHVHARVFHSADEESDVEGSWIDHELGVISYDDGGIRFLDRVDADSQLAAVWHDGLKPRAQDRFDRHQELHNGKDVNNMVYYLARQWTDAVKLRDSCYFVPAAYDGIEAYIDGFRALYEWLDAEYKDTGQATELFAINIMDSERERDMVERKVRRELEDEVDGVFDSVVEEVRDGAAADEIADEVVEGLSEVEGLAETHSAVLKTELSVKRAMTDVLQTMDDEREEVMDKVLAEAGLAPEVEA